MKTCSKIFVLCSNAFLYGTDILTTLQQPSSIPSLKKAAIKQLKHLFQKERLETKCFQAKMPSHTEKEAILIFMTLQLYSVMHIFVHVVIVVVELYLYDVCKLFTIV